MVHILQDMAQPQHTQNDSRSGKGCPVGGDDCWGGYGSFYEYYIDARAKGRDRFSVRQGFLERKDLTDIPLPVPTPGLTIDPFPKYPIPRFQSYVRYYSSVPVGGSVDTGLGLADYSHRGFYTFGTNIFSNGNSYPQPSPTGDGLARTTLVGEKGMGGAVLPGSITYLTGPVHDSFLNADDANVKLSTAGIFDQFLQPTLTFQYSLNYRNYDDQERLLVPRAVAYSSGLIDYFFRGRLSIALPDEGVYAIADQSASATDNDPQTGGFQTLKAKVQNLTQGVDANGNPINAAPQTLSFAFPSSKPIPFSATDIFLQVVYRGPLGTETDAVAVETKDISEPTYGFNVSRWDEFTYGSNWPVLSTPGTHSFEDWCNSANPPFPSFDDCKAANGITTKTQFGATNAPIPNYDPNSSNNPGPEATWLDLSTEGPFAPVVVTTAPVGTMSRFAWLTDAVPANTVVDIIESKDPTHNVAMFQWFSGVPRATVVQRDPATDTLTPSDTYAPSRKDVITGKELYVPPDLATLLTNGDVSPPPPLILKAVQKINF